MPGSIDPGEGVLEDIDFEAVLRQVFRGVADAELRGDAAYEDVLHVQQAQDLAEALAGGVHPLEAAVLLLRRVLALEEGQVLLDVGEERLVDIGPMGTLDAVRRPRPALLRERAVLFGMVVPHEQDRVGGMDAGLVGLRP